MLSGLGHALMLSGDGDWDGDGDFGTLGYNGQGSIRLHSRFKQLCTVDALAHATGSLELGNDFTDGESLPIDLIHVVPKVNPATLSDIQERANGSEQVRLCRPASLAIH